MYSHASARLLLAHNSPRILHMHDMNSSWTGGYTSDIEYTPGFYRELSPLYLAYMARLAGIQPPDINGEFTYCELACGRGLSTSIIAASFPQARFTGLDFNPAHIAEARQSVRESGLENINYEEWSFAQAADMPDDVLPQQDFITLHGTYTWVDRVRRQDIVRFVQNKLKPGGIFYLSYNTMPGWAPTLPLQHMMHEYARENPGRSDRQIEGALDFLTRLNDAGAKYFEAVPAAQNRLKNTVDKNRNYLVHEYMHTGWEPLYHSDVVRDLDAAKLTYIGTASVVENFPNLYLPDDIRKLVNQTRDPAFQQVIIDFTVNQQFRRDIFMRGPRQASGAERSKILGDQAFTLLSRPGNCEFEFKTPISRIRGKQDLYEKLVNALDKGAMRARDLARETQNSEPSVNQAMALMTSNAQVAPVLDAALEGQVPGTDSARDLNDFTMRRVLSGYKGSYMAGPVIANGLHFSSLDMMAYACYRDGTPKDLSKMMEGVQKHLDETGLYLTREGQAIKDPEEHKKELKDRVQTILDRKFPHWEKAGVI